MPEWIAFKKPLFTNSGCGPFTKNKERIQTFKETGDSRYIYRKELHKACFQHDMAYGDFKDLAGRTASDKVLSDKVFNFAKNTKYDGYQRGFASMVNKCFDKKSSSLAAISSTSASIKNEQLGEEIYKSIIKKF